jgi:hypothetical protein
MAAWPRAYRVARAVVAYAPAEEPAGVVDVGAVGVREELGIDQLLLKAG